MKNLLFKIFSSLLAILLISNCDDREDAFKLVPIASFTVSDSIIDLNGNVQFTDNSIYSPSSWSWDFGDNTTSNDKDPSHTYTNAGTYKVQLIVTNNYGSDSANKNIIVSESGKAPIASFIVSDSIIKVGQSVTFTDKSANIPESWKWEFGDGKLSTDQNTEYTYNNAGTYTIKLTVTNAFGENSITKSIKVGNTPVANFGATPTTIAAGESVQFTDSTANSPASWIWDFGDNNIGTGQNPKYTYNKAGIYNVKLTVKNDFGTDSITRAEYITVRSGKTDADGNEYKTVTIGTQVWMAENLKTTKYNDGKPIPNVTDTAKWAALTTPAYCWYNNDEATYKNTYGALYNWYAVNTNKLCPAGWHVPTDEEWKELEMALGMSQEDADMREYRGTNEGSKLAGNATLWNNGALLSDAEFGSSAFMALPGGCRLDDSKYIGIGDYGNWWCINDYGIKESSIDVAWFRFLPIDFSGIVRDAQNKNNGYSVRCLKDK